MSGNVNPQGRSFARTMEQTLAAGVVGASADMVAELASLMTDSTRFEIALIPQLTECVIQVSKTYPEADIIVRPHPIENSELWINRFNELDNVRVETGGALTEWLTQCDCMIYVSGCGSGLEATLQGVPEVMANLPLIGNFLKSWWRRTATLLYQNWPEPWKRPPGVSSMLHPLGVS